MNDVHEALTQLLEGAFRDMLHGSTPEARSAGERRATEIGTAHYNLLAEFIVKHPDMEVRHAGLIVAAAAENLIRSRRVVDAST